MGFVSASAPHSKIIFPAVAIPAGLIPLPCDFSRGGDKSPVPGSASGAFVTVTGVSKIHFRPASGLTHGQRHPAILASDCPAEARKKTISIYIGARR
jgi:hypothetical protein